MTPKDIPTHLVTTVSTKTTRISDYRERKVRLTESDMIRVLVLPVLRALGWHRFAVQRFETARSLIGSSQNRFHVCK